jgi:hypothetical protein
VPRLAVTQVGGTLGLDPIAAFGRNQSLAECVQLGGERGAAEGCEGRDSVR